MELIGNTDAVGDVAVGKTVVIYYKDKTKEKEVIQNVVGLSRADGFLDLKIDEDGDGIPDKDEAISLSLIARYVYK